jgi:hypothetical protein
MAAYTKKLVEESEKASFRQIGVQSWLELEKRFDSTEMKTARRSLAPIMMHYKLQSNELVHESVLNFFLNRLELLTKSVISIKT